MEALMAEAFPGTPSRIQIAAKLGTASYEDLANV
jgi:hypothetical protein